jgi:hypothetical protein
MKVLELFVEVATPKHDVEHVHSFDIDPPILIVNKLSTWINIIHSFSFFYYMPHTFLFFYLQNVVPTKELAFIQRL